MMRCRGFSPVDANVFVEDIDLCRDYSPSKYKSVHEPET